MPSKFLTEDGRIDRAKVRAEMRDRFAGKMTFINRYEGEPRRRWYYSIARRVICETNSAARSEHHNEVVWPIFQSRTIKFTKTEAVIVARADATMARAPIDRWGNLRFKEAARESRAIRDAAYERTLDAIRRELAA